MTNACEFPVTFTEARDQQAWERKDGARKDSVQPGETERVFTGGTGPVGPAFVGVAWSGIEGSVVFVEVPAEAFEPVESGGDLETDDIVATLAGDLCPDPVERATQ